jgi:hypothetical protein
MKTILYDMIGFILAVAIGFLVGWHCKKVSVEASQVREVKSDIVTIHKSVDTQAAAQTKQMQKQQDQTVGLMAQQSATRSAATDIQTGIAHATFAPRTIIKVVPGVCPDTDPVGSDDFEQLYNSAAKGVIHPAAASSAPTG